MRFSTLLVLTALAAPLAASTARAQTTAPVPPPAPVPAAPAPAEAPAAPAVVDGTWTYAMDTPNGPLSGTFRFATAADGAITGAMSNPMGPGETALAGLVRDGQALTFSFDSGEYGVIAMRLVFDGDAYAGTMSVMSMGIPIAGTRKVN